MQRNDKEIVPQKLRSAQGTVVHRSAYAQIANELVYVEHIDKRQNKLTCPFRESKLFKPTYKGFQELWCGDYDSIKNTSAT